MEGKPPIPIVYTDIAPGVGHLAPPAYSDPLNPTFSDPMQTQPILTQLFQSTGTRPKPINPFYQAPLTPEEIRTQYHTEQQIPSPRNTTQYHQIPNNNQQRTSPINYPSELDHPERILVSTPTGMAPPISTIPHLTPQLRTPPGFAYFPHHTPTLPHWD